MQALVSSLQGSADTNDDRVLLVEQPAVPPALAELWREAAEWHFSRDHCNCFGCNIFPPGAVVQSTETTFGDWENRGDWVGFERQPDAPSVADRGWLCVASFSEFDYLFCCFDSSSPHFGHVRHMVNNCCSERAVWSDIGILAARLLQWDAAGGDGEDEDEESALLAMLSSEGL